MRRLAIALPVALAGAVLVATPAAAYPRPGQTVRVSPVSDTAGNAASATNPAISGDGRWVAFTTSSRLVEEDGNNQLDVYLRDTVTGSLELVSVAPDGAAANGASSRPSLSRDGRFVAFQSTAADLVSGDRNGVTDVFVRDRSTGGTSLVSLGADGGQGDAASSQADISDDGSAVAFASTAANLVPGDTNAALDLFVRDLTAATTQRVSVDNGGAEAVTAVIAQYDMSGDGRFTVFVHRDPLAGDRSSFQDIFVHDRVSRTTDLVSVSSDGTPSNGNSFNPAISDDGRFVVFGTYGANLVPDDRNGAADPFVHDRATGTTERVSNTSAGVEANHVWGTPMISGDGRYVTGNVLGTNYGYADGNGNTDVYVYDRVGRTAELVSAVPDGSSTGNGLSPYPVISDDGRRVAFWSQASDLVGDGIGGTHVYLRDLGPELGIGAATVTPAGADYATVEGWARFGPQVLLQSGDSPADAGHAARLAGLELTGASVIARPEEGDVLFRLDLAPRTHAGTPFVGTNLQRPGAATYAVRLDLDGVAHEIRASTTPTGPAFGLFRCEASCVPAPGAITGGIGTIGDAVLISVPDSLLGTGTRVTLRAAYAAAGSGAEHVVDRLGLSPVTVPEVSVTVGSVAASVEAGRFSATVPAAEASQVSACVGRRCALTPLGG